MNNKSSMQGMASFVSGSAHPQTPTANSPPASLCFPASPKISEKQRKQQKYHPHPYHNVGLCGCQRASKSHCVSAVGEYFIIAHYYKITFAIWCRYQCDAAG